MKKIDQRLICFLKESCLVYVLYTVHYTVYCNICILYIVYCNKKKVCVRTIAFVLQYKKISLKIFSDISLCIAAG